MKKILTVALVLVLALGCVSFASASEYGEHLTATAVVFGSPGFTPTTDNYGTHLIEELFNIHLDVLPVDTATDEDWNTFWIDGYSDIIVPYSYSSILPLLAEDICRPFPIEWMKEYCPNMWTLLLQMYGDDEGIFAQLNYKGEVYCIPYFAMTNGISWITSIRKDWLENVGIEGAPTNMEELEALLDAFTYGDPDKNGVDDTYAIGSTTYGLWNLPAYYGCSSEINFVMGTDGKITTTMLSDGYKEYLAKLAEWYQKGYIDPEYVTDGRAEVRAKYAQNKLGIYSDNPWWFEKSRGEIGPLAMVVANNPNLTLKDGFVFFDNIPNADGEVYVLSLYGNIQGQAAIYFGYDCPDEVIIRMLQLQNARTRLFDGSEEDNERIKTRARMDIGVEGEAWTFNEETLSADPTPEYESTVAGFAGNYSTDNGLYIFPTSSGVNFKVFEGQDDEYVIELYEWALSPKKVWRGNNFVPPVLDAELQDKYDLINTCFYTFKNDIIQGTKTIEADWDAYVAEMESLGLADIIAAYEAALS